MFRLTISSLLFLKILHIRSAAHFALRLFIPLRAAGGTVLPQMHGKQRVLCIPPKMHFLPLLQTAQHTHCCIGRI